MRRTLACVIFAACALALGACDDSVETNAVVDESQVLVPETEPNDLTTTATPIVGASAVIRGDVSPNNDVDVYSFEAAAGDQLYVAVNTVASSSGDGDSRIQLIGPDGTTIVEQDDDSGSFSSFSSSIAGAQITATGTYYLRVFNFSTTVQIRPYDLHFALRSGAAVAEDDVANDTAPGQPIGAGWIEGAIAAGNVDFYAVTLNAGDTLFASLDLDPERDLTSDSPLALGFGPFEGTILLINDGGQAAGATETGPDSEALFMTVATAGTYAVRVAGSAGASAGTYRLNVTVHPAAPVAAACRTYAATIPAPLPVPDLSSFATALRSTIVVPDSMVIADLDVTATFTHAFPADLDAYLIAPDGNQVGLWTDKPGGTPQTFTVVLDDESAIPMASFTPVTGMKVRPEAVYRLSWFDGQQAAGTWTLVVADDGGADLGTLNAWSMTVCPAITTPTCGPGEIPVNVFASDFEADDGGFTHAGTADEWARGLPTAAPFTTCSSGVNCWKTDLAGTYNASSSQDLLSPAIDLSSLTGAVYLRWAQKYQMDTANNDHAFVDIQRPGGGTPRRLFEFRDAVMTDSSFGNPAGTIQQSAGWGSRFVDISAFAGGPIELRFHLDSNAATQLGGLAIDDVAVIGCVSDGSCGNGTPDPGEICDDGNDVEGDACDSNCTLPACGNGVVAPGEVCDDGNVVGGDACAPDCSSDLSCGNDIVDPGEQCDLGDADPGNGCSADCTSDLTCGNDVVDPGEQCDLGDTDPGNGCSADCSSDLSCGNDVLDPGEVCDDDNTASGDGCNSLCTSLEVCGNSVVDVGEACDLGDTDPGNGCNADCTSNLACGNGTTDPGELCDDGNTTAGDGCGPACNSNETCGNGVVDVDEACDDGDTTAGDGCNADCSSDESCGNDVLDPGEACDDGNASNGDGCESTCVLTGALVCGNGVVDVGEVCDDGNLVDGDGCGYNCRSDESCGNGFVDEDSEACDDGNTAAGDGCSATCTVEVDAFCGDGAVDTGEECDDDNVVNGDGCSAQCEVEPEAETGCGCAANGPGAGGNALLVLVGLVGLVGRRRKRRG